MLAVCIEFAAEIHCHLHSQQRYSKRDEARPARGHVWKYLQASIFSCLFSVVLSSDYWQPIMSYKLLAIVEPYFYIIHHRYVYVWTWHSSKVCARIKSNHVDGTTDMHETCAFTDIWMVSGPRVTCGDKKFGRGEYQLSWKMKWRQGASLDLKIKVLLGRVWASYPLV